MNVKILKYRMICLLSLLSLAASCSKSSVEHGAGEETESEYCVDLMVSTRKSEAQGNNDEQHIHSVYVYAFDDKYLSMPDVYFANKIDNAQSGTYPFKMKIQDEGTKRFYIFVNPPKYILSELKPVVREDLLKSLAVYIYNPAFRIVDLPQSVDGVTTDAMPKGLPMSNVFEAYVGSKQEGSRTAYLFPEKGSANAILDIPLFRSVGKISVLAQLKDNDLDQPIAVDRIELFNYSGEGYMLPIWDSREQPYWALQDNTMGWNPLLRLDLKKMAERETKIMTKPYALLRTPVEVQNKPQTMTPITHFYLCPNSYGKRANTDDTQEGLPDEMGNREMRMMVYMSDGRISEVILPYLRRNDNLRVILSISKLNFSVSFEKWTLTEVNPDWDETIK